MVRISVVLVVTFVAAVGALALIAGLHNGKHDARSAVGAFQQIGKDFAADVSTHTFPPRVFSVDYIRAVGERFARWAARRASGTKSSRKTAKTDAEAVTDPEQRFAEYYKPYSGRLFTKEELAQYDGASEDKSLPIMLALMGEVFDVTKGRDHYAKGGGYGFFSGRDASRAFVTGEFQGEGLREELGGLTPEQVLSVVDWGQFYKTSYTPVGRLVGHFFDDQGQPTENLKRYHEAAKQGLRNKDKEDESLKRFPPCNSRWAQNEGGEFWCSKDSGGIHRNWDGFLRQLREPNKASRCACVSEEDIDHPYTRLIPGCGKRETRCKNTLVDKKGVAV